MIAFDICARSISYLLCLISEFSSIIKIKSLLALPLMWHMSIFSKNHVQFLGTSAPWTYLEFQILLPAVWTDLVHCGMTCELWKYIVSWLFSPNQALEWPIFPTSLLTLLWFLSYPIKTILTLGEDWSFGLLQDDFSIKACCHGQSGSGWQAEYIFSVSSSIMLCTLNFSFKQQLRILTQSH